MVAIITCFSSAVGSQVEELFSTAAEGKLAAVSRHRTQTQPDTSRPACFAFFFFVFFSHVFFFWSSSDILLTAPVASISAKSVVGDCVWRRSFPCYMSPICEIHSLLEKRNNPNISVSKNDCSGESEADQTSVHDVILSLGKTTQFWRSSSSFDSAKFHIWYVVFKIKTQWTSLLHINQWQ